jgi:hypothetical protein
VCEWDLHLANRQHRLDRLLDRLLGVESDDVISLTLVRRQKLGRCQVTRRLSSSNSATSQCSGVGKYATLPKRALNDGPAYNGTTACQILSDNNDIDRGAQPLELSAKPNRLLRRVIDRRLDNEHVIIRPRISLTTSTRPEQHDPRSGRRRGRQAPSNLIDDLGLSHDQDGRAWVRRDAAGTATRIRCHDSHATSLIHAATDLSDAPVCDRDVMLSSIRHAISSIVSA